MTPTETPSASVGIRLNRLASSNTSHDDPRVITALEKYFALCENGPPPDRLEFLAQYPEISAQLSPCLEGLALVQAAVPGVSGDLQEAPGSAGGLAAHSSRLAPRDEASRATGSASADLPLPLVEGGVRVLGDFRILREVGRGGMGVVYEAEQLSLARRVALKVLPFASMLDPRHLQRFKNEALAAAHLDHSNIVEVHAVGCERGVHFYAMRFVEGQTLAEVIEEMRGESREASHCSRLAPRDEASIAAGSGSGCLMSRSDMTTMETTAAAHSSFPVPHSPLAETNAVAALSTLRTERPRDFFRLIAELGIQAAEALDHAHQMGIVHRDIKPSNLMVESSHLPGALRRDRTTPLPSRGEAGRAVKGSLTTDHRTLNPHLYITDFGLAHIESEATLTRTGDLLGTLRYMSPEQAEGKSAILDHRTDIYSLGVTLYEILTLRPAFPATDRQALLKQITQDEPPAPRKLNKHIPADLETIVLKSISKDPRDRYAYAADLAADLARFAEQKPIAARRPSTLDRAKRWIRTHAALVGILAVSIAVVGVALVVATGISLWQAAEASRARRQAAERLDVATGVLTLAGEQIANELANVPQASKLQRDILEECIRFYGQFTEEDRRENPPLQFAQVRAMRSLSGVYMKIHNHELRNRGRELLREAVSIQEKLSQNNPENRQYLRELGLLYSDYAHHLYMGQSPEPPLEPANKSLTIFRLLAERDPRDTDGKFDLAKSLLNLASQYRDEMGIRPGDRDLAKSESLTMEALTLVENIGDSVTSKKRAKLLADGYFSLALTLNIQNKFSEAELACRKSLEIYEQWLKREPTNIDLRRRTISINNSLAGILRAQSRLEDEGPFFQRAVELQTKFVQDFPERTDSLVFLTWLYDTRRQFFIQNEMWPEAGEMFREELKHQRHLLRAQSSKSHAENCRNNSLGYANVLYELGDMDAARVAYREALELGHLMVKAGKGATDAEIVTWVGFMEATCPFSDLCDYDRALTIVTRGASLHPQTDDTPFSDIHIALAMALYRCGDREKALETLSQGPTTTKYTLFNDADRLLWRCRILLDLRKIEAARKEFENAQAKAAGITPNADSHLARQRLFRECSEILAAQTELPGKT